MGLTKPRAYQIFDLDYKQSVRVVTDTNVTLTGGASNTVDGVALSLNDRVLVAGQSTGSQNGMYIVTTVGTGANGTWQRSIDTNETGELDSGTIVMVTEGVIYADTQWKLITNDPIVIGTTALVFQQNYSANSISAGTSNVVVRSNANVTVSSAGVANVLIVTSTGANVTGTLGVTGNVTGGNLIAGSGSGGNITGANVITANAVTVTGNVTGGNIIANGRPLTSLNASNIDTGTLAQARLANAAVTLGSTALTLGATVTTVAGLSSVTSTTFVGALTGAATTAGTVTTAAQPNITSVGTLSSVTVTGNVSGGNLTTAGQVSATGNITGGNLSGTGITGTLLTVAQTNITSVGTLGSLSVTGNTTSGNIVGILNGSGANVSSISATNISSGTLAQARLANSSLTVNGTAISLGGSGTITATATNALTIGTGLGGTSYNGSSPVTITNTGVLSLANGGGITASASTGAITLGSTATSANTASAIVARDASGNFSAGTITATLTGAATTAGTVTTAAQPNITSVGTLSSLAVTGNISGANLTGAHFGSGAGLTSIPNGALSNSSVTVNGTAISLGSSGTVTANAATLTGTVLNATVVSSSLTSVGTLASLTVTANVAGGNLTTVGQVTATGNVNGNFFIGNGRQLTGITGGGGGTPGGANTQIQFNDGGTFGATAGLTFNKTTNAVATTGTFAATGNISGNFFIGNGSQLTGIVGGSGIAFTSGANNPPVGPNNGDFWFDTFSDIKYQYINDGTSSQWIDQSFPTSFSSISVGNITNTNANGVGNIGSSVGFFNTVFAKATSAQYADLAEMYVADGYYPPGMVVVFGGKFEITLSTHNNDTAVAGIISTNPSYLMNSTQEGEWVLPVALTGRVPCRVQGPVSKGDVLVTNNTPGTARRIGLDYQPGCVIGKSLESIDDNCVKIIEVAVGRF